MSSIIIRDLAPPDAEALPGLALAAFAQFQSHYADWPVFSARVADFTALRQASSLIVAEMDGAVVGAVAYVSPQQPKLPFFEPHWASMRMLVVHPACRGLGAGRALAQACLDRARHDQAQVFALHTSPIMAVALPMYLRMGFALHGPAPDIFGVPYNVYTRAL